MLIVALGLAKWQIYNPLHAAEYGYTEVQIWPKLVGLAIFLGIYGLAMCIFGRVINDSIEIDPNNISWKSALTMVGLASIGFAVYLFVMMSLNDQGYVHSYF